MPPSAHRPDWDIFCTVIDNFGDIGVCWRLARQLATEHSLKVRLWVDDLQAFRALCPPIDARLSMQSAYGVEIRHWAGGASKTHELASEITPGDVVIEAFACHIPERFITRMVQCDPRPIWINLDYLSAEDWVAGCHALPSPHPRLPLVKYFFFPGFTHDTGGLLREKNLLVRRQNFSGDPVLQTEFWRAIGGAPPENTLRVSLFAYENPNIADLLHAWAVADTPICCLLPVSRALPAVESFCQQTLKAGDIVQRGALEIRLLPFVEQSRYDTLLWACDLNFVRGEDSFVRAQWAARPFVWHIYPQEENAHLRKLDAFLNLYCATLDEASSIVVRAFWQAWNSAPDTAPINWPALHGALPKLREHAVYWADKLAAQEDLAHSLLRFCRSQRSKL